MRTIPTIVPSSLNSSLFSSPTSDLRLEVSYYRRCADAHSTHTQNPPRL